MVLEQRNYLAFVAVNNNNIVRWIKAFIAIRIESKPCVEIGGLVVDEEFRNKNIGRKLVEAVAEWCRIEKIDTLRVRCNTKEKNHILFIKD